jgi:predicted ATPase
VSSVPLWCETVSPQRHRAHRVDLSGRCSMASAKATIDRDEIRKWVESRGGFPAHVRRTGDEDDPGVLRIDYPGFSGAGSLERISWDEFFEAFDTNNLAFLYQPTGQSRFSKLIDRNSVELERSLVARVASKLFGRGESTRKSGGRTGSKKSSSKKSSSKKSSSKKAASSKKSSTSRKAASSKKAGASRKSTSSKKRSASRKTSRSSKHR